MKEFDSTPKLVPVPNGSGLGGFAVSVNDVHVGFISQRRGMGMDSVWVALKGQPNEAQEVGRFYGRGAKDHALAKLLLATV